MAYLQQSEEDKDKAQGLNETLVPQPGAAPAQTPESTAPAAPSQAQTSAATPVQGAQQPNAKAGSGTFTNLKNYLSANQGNRVASAATQKVSNLATGAQKGIAQASTGFGQKVDQGTLANRQQAVQDVEKTTAAARGVEAIAAQPQAVEGAPAPTAPVESAQPQYLDDTQQKRFADIINAKYSGPESLRQSGLLQPAAEKVTTAARQIKNADTAGGREELLRSMYGKNRDYTQGQSKLDSLLLNTSQQGVSQLQEAAKAGGNLQQNLQQAEAGSQNLAQNRAQEIAGIREQARGTFQSGRTAEETATEARMDALIKTPVVDEAGNPVLKQDGTPMTEWDKLPEHFRASLANKAQGAKTVKSERLAELNKQYAPQVKAVQDVTNQAAATDKKIKELQKKVISLNMGTIAAGEGYSSPGQETIKARDEATKQLHSLQQQSAAQKNQASAMQQTPEFKQYQQEKAAAEGMNMNQWALSPEEAAVLGISSGEGLYNIGQGDIRTVAADREKLITQNEFARQQALSQLAGLDQSKALQKELLYKDQAKAGTQDLTKSLDTEAFRTLLNEAQQGFKESAEGANLTGTGKKKVSRGNWSGKRTKTYSAAESGNVADMLKQAGYDVGATGEGTKSLLSDKDALANYLGATSTSRGDSGSMYAEGAARTAQGAAAGASIGAMSGPAAPIGAGIGALIGTGYGSIIGPNSSLSNIVGDLGGGRMSSSSMAKVGMGTAKDLAIRDLQNKYAAYLKGQGFENRANVADTESTRARSAALNQLLQRKG
jgi:hypothetical protein